jgi:hypothetical protein
MMSKTEVEATISAAERSISTLDTWVLVFSVLVAICVIGSAVLGVVHWRKDKALHALRVTQAQLHEKELAQFATDIAEANARAATAQTRTAELELDLEHEKEKRLGRTLNKEQFDALQKLKGKVTKANVRRERNAEVSILADNIVVALLQAGIDPKIYFAPPGDIWTGIVVWSAKRDGDPLVEAFTKAGFLPTWMNIAAMVYPNVPHDVPLIEIGERFPEIKAPYFGPSR